MEIQFELFEDLMKYDYIEVEAKKRDLEYQDNSNDVSK